jgi:hypothetical protein
MIENEQQQEESGWLGKCYVIIIIIMITFNVHMTGQEPGIGWFFG